MKKLIIANWKSNPDSLVQAKKLGRDIDKPGVVIAPPYPFLESLGKTLRRATLGAQDVFGADRGAYTGEVSLSQLKDLKVKYIILGHSERRKFLGETDELINKKVKAALRAGFKTVLCVGEWRRQSLSQAKVFVRGQLKKDLAGVRSYRNLIITYEPVWAISTSKSGKPDKPENAAQMARFIKSIIKAKVIYGGSVNAKNARSFLKYKEIDGALVGGASLKPREFLKII